MKRFLIVIPLAAAIFSLACSSAEPEAQEAEMIQGVAVAPVSTAAMDEYYEAAGTVRSKTTSMLSAKVMGTVTAIHALEGTRVRAGQTLISIDDRDTAAQLRMAHAGLAEARQALAEVEQGIAAAEANRKLATATYERFRTLLERKSVSAQEFDEVEAKYTAANAMADSLRAKREQVLAKIEQARAGASGAEAYHSYSRIVSPIDGIVASRSIDVGSMAAPGQPLMVVEDPRAFRVDAFVEESAIGRIRVGDRARVRIDALGKEVAGRVAEIVPSSDPMSRKYQVKVDFDTADGSSALRSGLFAKVFFPTGSRQALTVPAEAVVRQGQLTGVWVVDGEGVARLRLITTGKTTGERTEVLSGLTDGERIVVDGMTAVRDGARVAA